MLNRISDGCTFKRTHGAEFDDQDLNSTAFGCHVLIMDLSNSPPPPGPKPRALIQGSTAS